MKIEFINYWTREFVAKDNKSMYLFTDNLGRSSGQNQGDINKSWYSQKWNVFYNFPNTSQACIRGLPNAFPITTMKDCHKTQLGDGDFEYMKNIWLLEFTMIKEMSQYYDYLKCSPRQFGNGTYSKIIYNSPKLFNMLSWYLWEYLGIDNRCETLKLI